jgi:hypothetical protein
MKRLELRIVWATIGVFVWLGGLYATIYGLLYELQREFRWGVLALVVGVATFVIALNPFAQRGSDKSDGSG